MKKKIAAPLAFIILLTLIYWFYGSENIKEVKIKPDSTNSTRAFIYYSYIAKNDSDVFAEYWEDGKKENVKRTSGEKSGNPIVLLGLNGDRTYYVRLVSKESKTDSYKFSTPSIPKAMLKSRWLDKLNEMPTGYILSQRYILRKKNPFGYVYMTDFLGDATWYQKVDGLPKISSFTKYNTVLVVSGNPQHERSAGNRLCEFDLLGNKIVDLKLDSLKEPFQIHHDVIYDTTDNFLALTYDIRKFVVEGKPIMVKGDAILRIDKMGNILWRWSVFDVEDPSNSKLKMDSVGEWGHANTLYQDLDGNYLVSFRDWNQIWKIDSKSGSILWKLGENGTIQIPEGLDFSGQHSIHINKDGDYMMYDNGVKNGQSHVLIFNIDEVNKKARLLRKIDLPKKLYSEKRGSAYFIDNDKILVCAPESSALAVIDLNGNILAFANTGLPDYYRATYIPSLY